MIEEISQYRRRKLMAKLVQIIPNFSEGQDEKFLEGMAKVASSVAGVTLINYSTDANHNRSGYTLVGSPEAAAEVAFEMIKFAAEKIDMTRHQGQHPRMGATDVCPFVPIKNVTTEECVELAEKLAERVGEELNIPVFLYEDAATKEERRNLATVRKGQFEGMAEKLQQAEWKPDFGPAEVHPTAGVTAIGVRMPLIAFNVNLDTDRLEVANEIAKTVRGSSGGYKYCKGIGIMLEDRQIAQVSMNITNYEKAPLYRILETIRFEAERYGVKILGAEVYGITPAKALIDSAAYYLQLEDFDFNVQVLENHLLE